jgi:hypothetical protein
LDIDRADQIVIHGTDFIGVSTSFQSLIDSQGIDAACVNPGPEGVVLGIELHTWKNVADGTGATSIEDVTFEGFGGSTCGSSAPFSYDVNSKTGIFDEYTWMKNLTFAYDSNSYVHFCGPNGRGIADVFTTDIDGSLRPKEWGDTLATKQLSSEVSTLIGRESRSLDFIDKNLCIDIPSHCYMYCESLCYQSVRFDVDAGTRSLQYQLEVCSLANPSLCIKIDGGRREAPDNDEHWSTRALMYVSHLPVGEYTAAFVDGNGIKVWPSYVYEKYETSNCLHGLGEGYIALEVPSVSLADCKELIRNGMVQSDATSSDPIWPWLHRTGRIELAKGQGIGGSDALKANLNGRKSPRIVQYIDNRCMPLLKDLTIEFKASIKLVDSGGRPVVCNPAIENCPSIGYTADGRYLSVATVASGVDGDGYQFATGRVTVGDLLLGANAIQFYASSPNAKLSMYLDNVSVALIEDSAQTASVKEFEPNSVPQVMIESEGSQLVPALYAEIDSAAILSDFGADDNIAIAYTVVDSECISSGWVSDCHPLVSCVVAAMLFYHNLY